jgi:hypothetical protein
LRWSSREEDGQMKRRMLACYAAVLLAAVGWGRRTAADVAGGIAKVLALHHAIRRKSFS